MDGAELRRFPHLSWFGADVQVRPGNGPWCVSWLSTCHSLCLTLNRPYSVRWIRQGREVNWTSTRGTVHFMPCDGRQHVLLTRAHEPCDFFLVFLPRRHVSQIARSEGLECRPDLQRLLLPDDPVLQQTLRTLSSCGLSLNDGLGHADEAARRLVLRLIELSTGKAPDWHDDAGAFDRHTLRHLVEYIDAHLKHAPSLSEMGMRVGLSPSHFAKKFRQSTGLSLNRFINRRRIRVSLEMLRSRSTCLAGVALELGFCSQSHFTRLFSHLTGITPARYQKSFKRTMG